VVAVLEVRALASREHNTGLEEALEAFGPHKNAVNKDTIKKWWQFWKF